MAVQSSNWESLCTRAQDALEAGQRAHARRLARAAAKLAPEQALPRQLLAELTDPAVTPPHESGLPFSRLRSGQVAVLGLLALTVAAAALAWLRPPQLDDGLRVMGAVAAEQVGGLLSQPAAQPTEPDIQPTATNTPFAQMSLLPSATPTSAPLVEATPEPEPTEFAEVQVALEKYDLRLPRSVESGERWIEVNLSTQTLTAYEGRNQVRSFIISSGRPRTPTVTGEFRIWIKVRMQDMSGPGYYIRNVPWVMFFHGDYGIHGTWWHTNFGTPMSAGCVNMTEADAKWLFDWASVGTIVQVHY
ncbi:MAG: L,D-transpeptidase [Anaerolineales bacterium]|nr:L,D-transpeptidase [Anaerolineales bacterium]